MDRIGRYKIVRELGRGAMGVVYHAIDPNIGRPVAIKTIQFGGMRNAEEQARLRERLFREARSAGMLSHPGIVTVYDVEQQGDLAYIAMEFVDGPTLDQVLSSPQPITPAQMFGILAQTAVALDYAHQKGIVHRDIKPANIMIAADGVAKIADFGIAKISTNDQLTMTGSIMGTPHYMSPEQVQGQAVDGRSDQFSLAVVAYEMLTGEKPYTGEHLTTVVYKIVAEEPAPPHRLNPSLGGPVEAVLRKGLAKKPDARYHTCQEFSEALEKACTATKNLKTMPRGGSLNEPTMSDRVVPVANAVALPAARRPRRGEGTATVERVGKRKSGFLPFLLAILMAAALLALIGWQASPWRKSGAESAQSNADDDTTPQPSTPAPTTAAAPASAPAASPPAQAPAEEKPSPMPEPDASGSGVTVQAQAPAAQPPVTAAPEKPPERRETKPTPPPRRAPQPVAAGPQMVTVMSSPAGATATLDGRPDAACQTPCEIPAAPGRHSIALSMPGYQIERREVDMGSSPLELPVVILRAPSGTLLLSSVPQGASIQINGKSIGRVTPAQIQLPPGSYRVTVDGSGSSVTSNVEIHDGQTRLLKVPLGQ